MNLSESNQSIHGFLIRTVNLFFFFFITFLTSEVTAKNSLADTSLVRDTPIIRTAASSQAK